VSHLELYYFEIDCGGYECTRFEPRWSNYGTIVASGHSLEECIEEASVDIMDQDGGELWVGPADSAWMQDLIEAEFRRRYPSGLRTRAEAEAREREPSDTQSNLKLYGPGEA
jgi:hypothetical protein